jgi:hypothetical protein
MVDMIHHLRVVRQVYKGLLPCNWHEYSIIVCELLRILTHVVQIELWSIILWRFLLAV